MPGLTKLSEAQQILRDVEAYRIVERAERRAQHIERLIASMSIGLFVFIILYVLGVVH